MVSKLLVKDCPGYISIAIYSHMRVPWTAKRSNPVNSKGNQPWIFIGRTDGETKAPVLWPPNAKS